MKKIFFSHSWTSYDTLIEKECIDYLQKEYSSCTIINPNGLNLSNDFDKAMNVVLPIIRECDILAWYKDDSYSPGVDMEIGEADDNNIMIIDLKNVM